MVYIKLFVFDLDDTLWNGERLYPDVLRILRSLKKHPNIQVAMLSYNWGANEICNRLGIIDYFDKIVCRCDSPVEWQDGKQTLMRKLVADFGVAPDEVVFYDDQEHNIVKTKEIGVYSFNVGHKGINKEFFVETLRTLA